MTKKIVITKAGYNATTETDPRNINFTSELPSLKYYLEGSASVSGGTGVTTTEITHNLGYIPFFVAYIGALNQGGDTDDFCMVPFIYLDGLDSFLGSAWADSTKIYLQIEHDLGITVSVTFHYKVFKNRTNL